jgi:putative spermidine/putrescine transport system substrate-binding protein
MGNLSTATPGQETLENGTAPIQINYDFVGVAQRARLAKKVGVAVSIPADGSIWGPSALMINKYDTAKADFLKAFLGYALSDAAQTEFARAGAHPIRYLNGDLALPAEATRSWLPEPAYARVREIDLGGLDPLRIGRGWEAAVTAGRR